MVNINTESAVDIHDQQYTKEPPMYKVLLHNDDFTPMDFVVKILIEIFNKDKLDAVSIMLNIHNNGIGLCGVYVLEIAETKSKMVQLRASQNRYPLKCTIEED